MPGNDFPLRGQSPDWLASLDPASQVEWRSLARESDPELYQEGLLHFASRQTSRGHEAIAGSIYQTMLQDPAGLRSSVLDRARARGEVLAGGGSSGARAEYLLRRMTQELSDPSMIVAMGAAGTVFRVTRLAALTRLSAGAPALLSRGWGARAVASAAAFSLEAPTFTLAHRLSGTTLGHAQDWSSQALARDFAGSYLMLGAMKLGGLGAGGLQSLSAARSPLASALFQQGGMLAGILVSQGMERRLGWRSAQSTDAAVTDALAMWLQFNVAGRLAQGVLGPRFQSWERSMDLQAAALGTRPRAGVLGADLLGNPMVPVLAGARLPTAEAKPTEIFGPQISMMTASSSGKGLGEPARLRSPLSPSREIRENGADPRAPFFSVEAPRSVRSEMGGDGERFFSYQLVLEDLNLFLRDRADRVIARRDEGEIRLRLLERETSTESSQFLPAGLEGYRFEIQEGATRGNWLVYVQKDGLMSFSLATDKMRPGVGGIVLDWMATQAAATGRQSQFAAIHNVGVFQIIRKRGLIDENSAVVEAHPWGRRHRQQSRPLGKFGDGDFLWRNRGGYFNIWAFPRKTLLPPELRSAEIPRERVAKNGETHPYQVRIEPFRDFLKQGHEAVIAHREGEDMRLRVESSKLSSRPGEFLPEGMPVVKVRLSEGDREGFATFHLNGDSLELFSIKTSEMRPGAGGIFMDWLATQAAAQGRGFGVVYIENAHILRILENLRLMEPGTQVQEGYRIREGFEARTFGALAGHRNLNANPFADFLLVRGRPSHELLPETIREPHQP